MPLSEHEQRILAELEESLVRHDPQFAERVRTRTLHHHASSQCKWSALTFLGGLAILVAFYTQSVVAGIAGVVIMFVSAVVFQQNLRHLGGAGRRGQGHPGGPEAGPSLYGTLRGTRDRIRSRLSRRDHPPRS